MITVKNGVVTLTGFVKKNWEAEDVAKRVAGVLDVFNDLDARPPSISQHPDPDRQRRGHHWATSRLW